MGHRKVIRDINRMHIAIRDTTAMLNGYLVRFLEFIARESIDPFLVGVSPSAIGKPADYRLRQNPFENDSIVFDRGDPADCLRLYLPYAYLDNPEKWEKGILREIKEANDMAYLAFLKAKMVSDHTITGAIPFEGESDGYRLAIFTEREGRGKKTYILNLQTGELMTALDEENFLFNHSVPFARIVSPKILSYNIKLLAASGKTYSSLFRKD